MMLFRKNIIPALTTVSLFLWPLLAKSQGYYFYDNGHYEPNWVLDASLNIGGMNCVTDIGGSKNGKGGLNAYNLRSTRIGGGFTLAASHRDVISIRLDVNFGKVEAHDSLLKGATHYSAVGRYERNLNFRSPVTEISVGAELHPLFLIDYQAADRFPPRFSPYIMAGVGMVNYRPQVYYQGNWVEVKPLRLEGQGFEEYPDRKEYSTTAITFPAGLGVRYEASRILILRLELIHRFTNTDYLDDVSMGDWVDPTLFNKYLSSGEATLATQLYNRSIKVNPPRNTRPRGDNSKPDNFWSFQFRMGFALNRGRF